MRRGRRFSNLLGRLGRLIAIVSIMPVSTLAACEIIAHRGVSSDAPQNTLAAFRLAWEQNADAVEGDFSLTKDGRVVCIHDPDTESVAGTRLVVGQATLAELRKLDVGRLKGEQWARERIPTLEEVLAIVPDGKQIFIHCDQTIFPYLKNCLADSGLRPEQVVIISWSSGALAEARQVLSGHKTLWLMGRERDKETGKWKPETVQLLKVLDECGIDGFNSDPSIDEDLIKAAHQAHKEIYVWGINRPDHAERLKQFGVDGITTDCPGLLKE